MYKFIDYPKNPNGGAVGNMPYPLLAEDKTCLHNISHGRPSGCMADVQITAQAARLRDDLLSLPGVEEIALYENWMHRGREVFVGRSGALTWKEFQDATKAYFAELSSEPSRTGLLAQEMVRAKKCLDRPVFLIEKFPHAPYHFAVHVRRLLTKSTIINLNEDGRVKAEPYYPFFTQILAELVPAKVWITPYSVSVHLEREAGSDRVTTALEKVVKLLHSKLYPGQELGLRERVTFPQPYAVSDDEEELLGEKW